MSSNLPNISVTEQVMFEKDISDALMRFRLSLYLYGIPIGNEREDALAKVGMINKKSGNFSELVNFDNTYRSFQESNTGRLNENFSNDIFQDLTKSERFEFNARIKNDLNTDFLVGEKDISREDWIPDGLKVEYEPEFWEWIINLSRGWQYYKPYRKFDLYCRQSKQWIDQKVVFDPRSSREVKMEFVQLERERMLENSLYGLTKYGFIKNDQSTTSKGLKYEAWLAQAVMLYLFDLTVSWIMPKARQIGSSTTIGAATATKTMLRNDFFTKMVAEKGQKTEEIFRDKVKFTIDKYPRYITPSISHDSATVLRFMRKLPGQKGKTGGANSIFQVEPPTATCINGGSPSIVLIDEAGLIDILSDIISQGRPTIYGYNPVTRQQEYLRQLIIWGTGGNMKGGGSAFEQEYKTAKERWKDRDFAGGLIPLFLNVFAREGYSMSLYMSEKREAYMKDKKGGKEDPKIAFHQSCPITEDEVFLTSTETLIPITTINKHIEKCNIAKRDKLQIYRRGYFKPLFDNNVKNDENDDVPFKIIGATFEPCGEEDILKSTPLSCACILEAPQRGWIDRYYQGSDPIFTASGTSNFASAIWDQRRKRFSAYIDFKAEDYRFCYLQGLLMNLFYSDYHMGKAAGIKHLVESNVGGEYINYIDRKGFRGTLIHKAKLPDVLQGGGDIVGIKKTPKSSPFIITELEKLIVTHLDDIYVDRFFEQLKTFVKKETSLTTSYAPINKEYFKDDILDACNYAKIAANCYENRVPRLVSESEAQKAVKKMRYAYDANHNLVLTGGSGMGSYPTERGGMGIGETIFNF